MVFGKIRELLSEQMGIDEDSITLESSFADDLNADSLDIVELIMAMEEEFDIEIADEDIEKIQTVGDAVNYIKERTN